MALSRINRNLRWVKRQCDLAGRTDIIEEEILDAMNYAQLEIMERSGDVKKSTALTFDSGTYPTGVYPIPDGMDRITYVAYPQAWTRPLITTNDPMVYDNIVKGNVGGDSPLVMLIYDGSLTFWPLPTDGETITLYWFKTPKLDGTENMVEGAGDPLLSVHWDMVIRYMALATLLGGDWIQKSNVEYNREAHHHVQDSGYPLLIDHSSNRLGF